MIELPKYPAVKVQLSGVDDNALAIMGAVSARCAGPVSLTRRSRYFWRRARAETMTTC